MYPTHAGPIGCIMLALWPHKYKVGHIDLILIKHQNLLNSPKLPKFSYVSHYYNLLNKRLQYLHKTLQDFKSEIGNDK